MSNSINTGPSPVIRTIRYLFKRIITIAITIFIGVFGTVLLINRTGQLDLSIMSPVANDVYQKMWNDGWTSFEQEGFDETYSKLLEKEISTRPRGTGTRISQRHID